MALLRLVWVERFQGQAFPGAWRLRRAAGDLYIGQARGRGNENPEVVRGMDVVGDSGLGGRRSDDQLMDTPGPAYRSVSYTHLTLPTILLV